MPDLRRKVLFTFLVLAVYRLGVHIPVPGINTDILYGLSSSHLGSGFLSYLDLFSGGALRNFAIFALGMGPYINASIMMQVFSFTIPSFEKLAKEGDYGRRVINQYTRYLAVILSFGQGLGLSYMMQRQVANITLSPGIGFRLSTMFLLAVGSLFVMWLGEQINSHGIGNGSSMIIFSGIVSGLPAACMRLMNDLQLGQMDLLMVLMLIFITVGVLFCVIFLEKGERRIPIHYPRKVVGNRIYGGQTSYIPFKLNSASVVPVIFSGSFLSMVLTILSIGFLKQFYYVNMLAQMLDFQAMVGTVVRALLIVLFAIMYTGLMFNPIELAENIRKSGGFIPKIRPGKRTAELFQYILMRVSFPGALYLAILAIAPSLVKQWAGFTVMFEGTSLLIVIGVALDLSAQLESYLIERRYEGFLASGRLKNRAGR